MSGKEKELYEFGQFRLDLTERLLVRTSGERVPISDKAFETLRILVQNSGHLVSKEELLGEVWGDSFVEENNLDKCIYTIRRALGENTGKHKYIETVRKHGFRFVAEVHHVPTDNGILHDENGFPSIESAFAPAQLRPPETDAGRQEAAPRRSRLPIVALASVFVLGGVVLAYFYFGQRSSSLVGTRSIAVLPFLPINTNRDEIYEMGLAESVIHQLSATRGLTVRRLSATRAYTEIERDPLAAGREQRVDYVVSSNYQLAEGKIKITSQLINVSTMQVEELYKVEKEISSVFAVQDAVADDLGKKLIARFALPASRPVEKRGTISEDAYRLYVQGMILYDKRNATKAIESFEQAVTLDPNYARAWAGKAHAHRVAAWTRVHNVSEEYQRSIEAAHKALALDPNLSEAYSALCENKFTYEYDFAGAERDCKRALELDSTSPMAHSIYSSFLTSRGRHDEAIAEIKTAIDLDPTSSFNQRVYANNLYLARRYEEAVAQYKRLIEIDEEAPPTYQWLIRTLEMQENESEAFEWFIRSLTVEKQDDQTIQLYKTAYQRHGWRGILVERGRTCDEANPNYFRCAGWKARIGDKDKAFEYLETSYQRRNAGMAWLQVEPQFDPLRDDPRYSDLVGRIEGR